MNMYDPYNPYNNYNPYDPRYEIMPSKGGAWGLLIFASIIALVDVYFWLPFYRACTANGHNVLAAIQADIKTFALFAGFFVVYLILSIVANVKFSKCSKFYGVSFGSIFARIIILLEYAAYAFAIICLFI